MSKIFASKINLLGIWLSLAEWGDAKNDCFEEDKELISKSNLEYFFFLQTSLWLLPYVLLVSKNMDVKLYWHPELECNEDNLIFINNLYASLHKVIAKHFFIKTFDIAKSNKKILLKQMPHYGNDIPAA